MRLTTSLLPYGLLVRYPIINPHTLLTFFNTTQCSPESPLYPCMGTRSQTREGWTIFETVIVYPLRGSSPTPGQDSEYVWRTWARSTSLSSSGTETYHPGHVQMPSSSSCGGRLAGKYCMLYLWFYGLNIFPADFLKKRLMDAARFGG